MDDNSCPIGIGINFVDKILARKPWLIIDDSQSFWPNLKRGLCYFAAEYTTKSPQVRETFRKHLLLKEDSDKNNESASSLVKEFSDESPVLKEMLLSSPPPS